MAMEPGVHKRQDDVLVDPTKLDAESKAEFLKRRAAERKLQNKASKILEEWYCLNQNGTKLLKKVLKANGGIYSFFMFRVTKKTNMKLYKEHYEKECKPQNYDPRANYEALKKRK
jgi:hypothetical protein